LDNYQESLNDARSTKR